MAFLSASSSRLIVDAYPISRLVTSWQASTTTATYERTSIEDTAQAYILGQDTSTLSMTTMLDADTTAGGAWDVLTSRFADRTLRPVTFTEEGFTAGNACWLADAWQLSASFSASVTAAVDVPLEFGCSGDTVRGVVLQQATVTATGNSAVVDLGAAGSNGGIAHLHVTAASGTSPQLDVVIEHSTSGSGSWATLATFTADVAAPSSERVVVAAGTTVRRYLRVASTVDGTDPSFDITVAFARS